MVRKCLVSLISRVYTRKENSFLAVTLSVGAKKMKGRGRKVFPTKVFSRFVFGFG